MADHVSVLAVLPWSPGENMSIGRQFRIRESMIFSIRAEFQNLLNRTGMTTGGFGYINNTTLAVPPRIGTGGQILVLNGANNAPNCH
jgi:hypothetical protein